MRLGFPGVVLGWPACAGCRSWYLSPAVGVVWQGFVWDNLVS